MSLGGPALGSALALAVGAPPSAGGMFAALGGVIASWAPANIQVNPGAMTAASGAVSGLGSFTVNGEAAELGALFCDALTIPITATDSRAVWLAVAQAIVDHLNNFGIANGTGFSSGVPLTGAGTVSFASPVFVPPLALRFTPPVTDPVAAALLVLFDTALIAYLTANASVSAISLSGPALSAPSDGPVTGSGTIS